MEAVANTLTSPVATGGGFIPEGSNSLGRDEFLQLLVAQLQAQDPLNPQDSAEFTAQLAQFSSLEQLFNVNSGIQTLTQFEAAIANTQAASFIGREVTAYGNRLTVGEGSASGAEFTLMDDADTVSIQIRSEDGSVVRTVDLGEMEAGSHEFEWDGLLDDGTVAANGNYDITVSALNEGGDVASEIFIRGLVEGVEFDFDGTHLLVDGKRVPLSDIVEVRAAPAA